MIIKFSLLNSDYNDDKDINNEDFLSQIRQPVRDFLALNCTSFANRDCEAKFSEIFSSCVFDKFIKEEKDIFQTYVIN